MIDQRKLAEQAEKMKLIFKMIGIDVTEYCEVLTGTFASCRLSVNVKGEYEDEVLTFSMCCLGVGISC